MSQTAHDEGAIFRLVEDILTDMTGDWDNAFEDPIGLGTRLIEDLGFESIDVVEFVAELEERFQPARIPVEELVMADGRYVDEIRVSDVVSFLGRHVAAGAGGS